GVRGSLGPCTRNVTQRPVGSQVEQRWKKVALFVEFYFQTVKCAFKAEWPSRVIVRGNRRAEIDTDIESFASRERGGYRARQLHLGDFATVNKQTHNALLAWPLDVGDCGEFMFSGWQRILAARLVLFDDHHVVK